MTESPVCAFCLSMLIFDREQGQVELYTIDEDSRVRVVEPTTHGYRVIDFIDEIVAGDYQVRNSKTMYRYLPAVTLYLGTAICEQHAPSVGASTRELEVNYVRN